MKTLTVRLPEALVAQIEAESRRRKLPKSDIVRERLRGAASSRRRPGPLDAIADLIGSVDGLPADLSAQRKAHLRATGYGQKRPCCGHPALVPARVAQAVEQRAAGACGGFSSTTTAPAARAGCGSADRARRRWATRRMRN